MTDFASLGLAKPLLTALAAEGYTKPTPIQAQAIPLVMEGKDLLGIAQTGTGKTAAFALPILHRLAENKKAAPRRGCRCLVLSPTRELATQIADSFRAYGAGLGLTVHVVFGGVKYGPQVRALAGGVDVLVATPGRLIDHINEKVANLSETEIFVLDEADQMLDMGFVVPIRRIAKTLPHKRQNLFFSATMPSDIEKLAGELLHNPSKVSVTPQATTVEKIEQKILFVEAARKRALLAELFDDQAMKRVLVFTRTKRGADRVAKGLTTIGIEAASIHGDKTQGQRERALASFKSGDMRALVATDIAARGIDVDGVTHVIQFELPNVPEAYVHRIGRTARAGANGAAISLVADDERNLLKDIQKVTRQTIPSWDRRNDRVLGAAQAALAATEPKGGGREERSAGGGGRGRGPNSSGAGRKSQQPAGAKKPQALDASGKPQPDRGQRARHRPAGYEPLAAGAAGDAPPKRKRNRGRNRGKGGQSQGAQA
jgi:ATP-dependent RNA helicase RhlE